MGSGWETSLQRIVMTALYATVVAVVVYFVLSWAADISREADTAFDRVLPPTVSPAATSTSIIRLPSSH